MVGEIDEENPPGVGIVEGGPQADLRGHVGGDPEADELDRPRILMGHRRGVEVALGVGVVGHGGSLGGAEA